MVDKATRRSRRAQRRKEQGTSSGEGNTDPTEAAGATESAVASDEDGATSEGPASRASGKAARESAGEPGEAERLLPMQRKKKKKKRATSSPDRIRDRNARIRERARQRREASAQGLAAGEMVDDALARWTQTTTEWLKNHFSIVQWVVVALIASGIGWEIYSWHHTKQIEKASDKLIAAVEDENAKLPNHDVSGPEADFDPRKTFPSDKAREEAAIKSYRAAAAIAKGSGTSILATLGLAGVKYDQSEFGAARQDYESVKASKLAQHDTDVKGRALEGVGMCLEAQNKLDAAAKAYRELENMEVPGLESLALYHQARVAFEKGEKDKAKGLLQKVEKKLADSDSPYPPNGYLAQMSRQLLTAINPGEAAARRQRPGRQLTPQQIAKLREQIQKDPSKLKALMQSMGLKLPAPAPAPAPASSTP